MLKSAAAAAALFISVVLAAASPQAHAQTAALTLQNSPANGATVAGSIAWTTTVSGGTPDHIDYLIDGTLKWTERAAPYRYNGDSGYLDTKTLSDGTHALLARSITAAGEISTATSTVTVANNPTSPPPPASSLAVTNATPANGATLSGSVRWEAQMTAGAATQIDFLIDGTQKWTERGAPYVYNGDTGSLDTKTLSNGVHTLMVRATDAGGHTATSSITVTVANVASTTLNRTVYCLGSPNYGTGGFAYDGTQFGWIRLYPKNLPSRVSFAGSVSLMKGVGCDTVKAQIQPDDPDPNGSNGPQHAQLYSTDSLVAKYGNLPSFGAVRGNYKWYSFAISTPAGGYKPQSSAAYPNWNELFSWHNGGSAGAPNVILEVATAQQSGCGGAFTKLATPRLEFEVNGGNWSQYPYSGATCRRFFGPNFVAGQRYTIEMGIKWADNGTGTFEGWINGQQVANVSGISNLWTGDNVYPIFENYRPGKAQIGNMITWTNDVYYAGLIAGPTHADVALPGS